MTRLLFFALLVSSFTANTQGFLSGFVIDAISKEHLNGAALSVLGENDGFLSDQVGFFRIPVSKLESDFLVIVQYVGYQTDTFVLDRTDQVYYLGLAPGVDLNPVVVSSSTVAAVKHEMVTLSARGIQSIPSLLGETDVLNSFQLLPGVGRGSEGSGGLFVRGGTPDQNLILLDGIPVYYAYHLGGFTSSFNPVTVNNVTLYHNYIPARYSGRLSSVIDVRTLDGHPEQWNRSLTIGMLSCSYAFSGPLIKNKLTLSASIRRSPYDLLLNGFLRYLQKEEFTGGYYLMDGQLKLNYRIDSLNNLILNYYGSGDKSYIRGRLTDFDIEEYPDEKFRYQALASSGWGNQLLGVTWRKIGRSWASNLRVNYSHFYFRTGSNLELKSAERILNKFEQNINSTIDEISSSFDLSRQLGSKNELNVGIEMNYRNNVPLRLGLVNRDRDRNVDTIVGDVNLHSLQTNLFGEWAWRIPDLFLEIKSGLNATVFSVRNTTRFNVSPRLIIHFRKQDKWLHSLSYQHHNQPLHLLGNSSNGFPADVWVPGTDLIAPQLADQLWLGTTYFKGDWSISVGAYYKTFRNLIQLKDGKGLFAAEDLIDKLELNGLGRSKGFESQISKKVGRLQGWLSYTLSKSERQFLNLNRGAWFRSPYDRRHDLSLVLNYDFSQKISLGTTFTLLSGNAITFPASQYLLDTDNLTDAYQNSQRLSTIYDVELINNFQTPLYHRLDIAIQFKKKTSKYLRVWKLGFYNTYNRLNPYYYYIDRDQADGRPKLYSISIFPILPSFSFTKSW